MKPTVFLTGATGFLGMEVLARLLEEGDREVLALIRASDDAAAERRLDDVLRKLWDDPSPYRGRVTAVRGDVTAPGLGLGSRRDEWATRAQAVVHCAASISFDLPLAEARAINVDGTARVLDFAVEAQARDGGLERFLHVSTAYVAGRYEGTFRERQLDAGQAFRNTYEETKADAEQIVTLARELGPAIARPSIVVGESDSGWTPAFNVLYWPLRAFSRGMFKEVPALADGHVDIVPIDYVADSLMHLLGRREAGVFNLVSGRNAPQVAEVVNLASDWFGKPHPKLVEPVGPEHLGDDRGDVFVPYFDMRVVFDDTRARAVLGPAGIEAPILRDYFGRLMEYAEAARWGKQGISREAARKRLVVPA
jgi:nucleoside-diphosphate-sugar epimerase